MGMLAEIIGGMEVKYWGNVSLYIKDIFHKTLFTKHCLQNILHDHKN